MDPATIDADKNTRDQIQITLVQYQSELAQLQTTQSQYQQPYNNLFQSYQNLLIAEMQSSSGVIQQNPALPPVLPVKPKPVTYAILAAVIGLMIAAGGIFLIEFLDNTIRSPEEITRDWGVPVLGTIMTYAHDEDSLITALQPRSPITEMFRSLRTNLNFASFNRTAHTILITSPSPEDGKTTVTVNLANVIAQSGRSVVVVDADLRRPRIHKVFQISNRVGLSNQFINPKDHFDGSLKQTEISGLQVLTSGNLPPNPAELLGSEKMVEILTQLSSQFDTTILDAPPLLMVTDALVLAPRVDGVILVVKPTVTKRAALKNAFDQLKHVNANVLGVVLNDVKINRSRYYHYSGYHYNQKYNKGYYHEEQPRSSKKAEAVLPGRDARESELREDLKNTPEKQSKFIRLLSPNEKENKH